MAKSYLSESAEGIQELESFTKANRLKGTPINRTSIDEGNEWHTIYLTRMRTDNRVETTDVLVKFTAKYNTVTHRLLVSYLILLTPALYSCKCVIGDILAVAV